MLPPGVMLLEQFLDAVLATGNASLPQSREQVLLLLGVVAAVHKDSEEVQHLLHLGQVESPRPKRCVALALSRLNTSCSCRSVSVAVMASPFLLGKSSRSRLTRL
jgi:hypothetical protein